MNRRFQSQSEAYENQLNALLSSKGLNEDEANWLINNYRTLTNEELEQTIGKDAVAQFKRLCNLLKK
jgi:hypothetical protein